MLKYINPAKSYILICDASLNDLGCILSQEDNSDKLKLIELIDQQKTSLDCMSPTAMKRGLLNKSFVTHDLVPVHGSSRAVNNHNDASLAKISPTLL